MSIIFAENIGKSEKCAVVNGAKDSIGEIQIDFNAVKHGIKANQNKADDARNTIWKLNEAREIPGELELLNAICKNPKDLSIKKNIENLLKEYISLLSIAYNYELKPKALLSMLLCVFY